MDAKKFTELLRKFTFSRFRIINIKLWGNNRWGLYREFSIDDVVTLIHEFNSLSTPPTIEQEIELPSDKELFKSGSNYAILSRLCEQYYIYEGSDKLQKKIIAEVEEIIEELRNDNNAQAQFEQALNYRQDNIMERFRKEHPTLKEKDYRLYAYLAAGLSATTIAVLLGREKSVIYNRISRLKKQIKKDFIP